MQNRDSIDAVLEASQRCWDLAGQLMNEAAAALDLWAIAEEADYALREVRRDHASTVREPFAEAAGKLLGRLRRFYTEGTKRLEATPTGEHCLANDEIVQRIQRLAVRRPRCASGKLRGVERGSKSCIVRHIVVIIAVSWCTHGLHMCTARRRRCEIRF